MKWVLIVTWLVQGQPATTFQVPFATEKLCKQAEGIYTTELDVWFNARHLPERANFGYGGRLRADGGLKRCSTRTDVRVRTP